MNSPAAVFSSVGYSSGFSYTVYSTAAFRESGNRMSLSSAPNESSWYSFVPSNASNAVIVYAFIQTAAFAIIIPG